MLRRRNQRRTDAPDGSRSTRTRRFVPGLVEAGWVLPASLTADQPPTATRLGVSDSPWTALVDGRGAVSPTPGWFTLDWAIGADDRWYLPAREPGVEQVRVEHAPVVETRMRVPGGHVVHRAWVGRGPSFPGDDEWLNVEVENASTLPVALAWIVRPWTPAGLAYVSTIDLRPVRDESGPWQLHVMDLAAVLPRRPSRWAAGGGDAGGPDPVATVLAGEAVAAWDDLEAWHPSGAADALDADVVWEVRAGTLTVTSDEALASLALLVPVPHTATGTIALPRGVRDDGVSALGWPVERPDATAVARGWTTLADMGPRIEVPDPVLADAVAAARRSVALCHRARRRPAQDLGRAAPVIHRITAAGEWGGPTPTPVGEQMEILETLAWWGHHETVDRALVDWPAGQQRGGGFGDEAATAAALRALAAHAVAAGDAGPARAWLPEVGGAVEWLGRRARRGGDLDPAVLAEGLDAGALLLAALDQPQAAVAIAADARAAAARRAVAPPSGLDLDVPGTTPRAVAAAAVAATRARGDASAVWALLRRASSTWTWPDPERWVGDDGLVPARLLTAVGRMLVADGPDGVALTTWMPPAWWGLGWEVHGAPTRWGRLSYAVRWHSGRPALLWELGEPRLGVAGDCVLTAPGLDRSWSSTERRGEALLTAVPPPLGVEVGPEVATGGVAVAAPPRSVWRPQDPGPDAPPTPGAPAPEASDAPPDEPGSFI